MLSIAQETWGFQFIGIPTSLRITGTNYYFHKCRPAFLDALVPLLDSGVTKFNKRCVSLGRASSGRQVLHFADHTTYEADLVIGADGIKSVVRNAVVNGHLVFSNTYAYRGLIPIDALKSAGLKAEIQSGPRNWVGLGGVRTSLLGILNRSLYTIL
jgi:flavin-dependent dehydrogenase